MKLPGIIGTGSALPDRVMTNQDLEKIVDTSDEWIFTRTGIRTRYIAGEETATSDLAVVAARKALESASLEPTDLDMIIVATYTPDMLLPSTAAVVQNKLGAGSATSFDMSAGCTGFIYGLAVGSQFITTNMAENILVIGADTHTKFVDWTDRGTCVLMGDGAGAVILSHVPKGRGILGFDLGTDGSGWHHLTIPAGGSRIPPSANADNGTSHFLKMNGREIFKFGKNIVPKSLRVVTKKCGLTMEDVKLLIPHQANIRIIKSAMNKLSFPMNRVLVNLDRYGNTSAATIPIGIDEAVRGERIIDGDIVALVGFGAGLTWGSAILKK
jgi:3-oxoacyl-[acyl-carrier-protein] synthase-3